MQWTVFWRNDFKVDSSFSPKFLSSSSWVLVRKRRSIFILIFHGRWDFGLNFEL